MKQRAEGNGINVKGRLSGGLNVDNTVNNTVNQTVNHITASEEDYHLNGKALELILRRDISAAVEPYALELARVGAETESLHAALEAEREASHILRLDNEEMATQLRRRSLPLKLFLVIGAVLILASGVTGLVVGRSVRSTQASVSVSSSKPVPSPIPTPEVASAGEILAAQELVRNYFDLARTHEVEKMWLLVGPDFQVESGGWKEFDSYWGNRVVESQYLISPGHAPVLDPEHPEWVWVQAAWRTTTNRSTAISNRSWLLGWFPVAETPAGLRIISIGKKGNPSECPADSVAPCSLRDGDGPH